MRHILLELQSSVSEYASDFSLEPKILVRKDMWGVGVCNHF